VAQNSLLGILFSVYTESSSGLIQSWILSTMSMLKTHSLDLSSNLQRIYETALSHSLCVEKQNWP
jgi:hypothetical protein